MILFIEYNSSFIERHCFENGMRRIMKRNEFTKNKNFAILCKRVLSTEVIQYILY